MVHRSPERISASDSAAILTESPARMYASRLSLSPNAFSTDRSLTSVIVQSALKTWYSAKGDIFAASATSSTVHWRATSLRTRRPMSLRLLISLMVATTSPSLMVPHPLPHVPTGPVNVTRTDPTARPVAGDAVRLPPGQPAAAFEPNPADLRPP